MHKSRRNKIKSRLILTIDQSVLESMKAYAAKEHTSISELVETYFKGISKPVRRKNILHLVDQLDSSVIDQRANLKELFYTEQKK